PRNLTQLDLSRNNITVVEEACLIDFTEVHTLNLSHNKIRSIPWTASIFENLTVLDLSYNQLSSATIRSRMPQLRRLSLAGNPITLISFEDFGIFPMLQLLNLSETLLVSDLDESTVVPPFRSTATPVNNLRELDLSGTRLTDLDQYWCEYLANLEVLHLRQMLILKSLTANLFKCLPNLTTLSCRGSRSLTYFNTKILEDAQHLQFLSLENCNLTTFASWNISSPNITFNLLGNPLQCSCELTWVSNSEKQFVFNRVDDVTCEKEDNGMRTSISLFMLAKNCSVNDSQIVSKPENVSSTTNLIMKLTSLDSLRKDLSSPATEITVFPKSTSQLSLKTNSTVESTFSNKQSVVSHNQSEWTSINTVFTTATTPITVMATAPTYAAATTPTTVMATTPTTIMATTPTTAATTTSTTPLPPRPTTVGEIPIHEVGYYDYTNPVEKPVQDIILKPCDYNPCRHLQKPCIELQRSLDCLCPGLRQDNEIPDSPRLKEVSEITDTSAQVHWCAPNSVVTKYKITYQPEGTESEWSIDGIYTTARQYSLYMLSSDTEYHICVSAFNKGGWSRNKSPSSITGPCTTFKTKPSYRTLIILSTVANGIFLFAVIVLSVCLCKKCKTRALASPYLESTYSIKNPT
uniref:Leucine rich repeat neuronal 4 n=1 Tax=Latimeria chalumnae TaxID=7897 RepID=H3B973_LATCH